MARGGGGGGGGGGRGLGGLASPIPPSRYAVGGDDNRDNDPRRGPGTTFADDGGYGYDDGANYNDMGLNGRDPRRGLESYRTGTTTRNARGDWYRTSDDYYRSGFRGGGGRENDRLLPGRNMINGGREIAFNRSRPSSIVGDYANGLLGRGGDDGSSRPPMGGRGGEYDERSRIMPPPPPSRSSTYSYSTSSQGPGVEYDIRRRGERQQQYGSDIAFDSSRPRQYYGTDTGRSDDGAYVEGNRQDQRPIEIESATIGQKRPIENEVKGITYGQEGGVGAEQSPSGNEVRRTTTYGQKSRSMPKQQSGSNRMQQSGGPGMRQERQPRPRREDRPKQKSFGNGLDTVKNMMDGISNLIMDRSTNEEERITKVLLSDAQRFLIADPAIGNVLGDKITLGKTYSRSYTSTMVNDVSRSRIQIAFPITGSVRVTGQGTLIANQDGITSLEVDVDGRVYDVTISDKQ